MYPYIRDIHAITGILVFVLLLAAFINSLLGFSGKREFTPKDRKLSLFALIFTHIQFVVGLVIWFLSPLGKSAMSQMSDASLRLTAVEHPFVNLIAIVLITIGWSKHKRKTDSASKFKSFLIFYGVGIVLLLSRIPWNLLSDTLKDLLS